jgi:hypothetical protein
MMNERAALPRDPTDHHTVAIRHRVIAGPINRSFFVASVCGVLAYILWPSSPDWWAFGIFSVILGMGSAALAIRGVQLLVRDYRLRRDLAFAQAVSVDHGSAQVAGRDERDTRGMHDWRSGDLLGVDEDGDPAFRPEDAVHGLYEMPSGVGKTVCHVIGSILHHAMRGYSVLVSDPKQELGVMLAPKLRELGFEVWCANPTKAFMETCGDVELNPYQALIDAAHAQGAERLDAPQTAADYTTLHYPDEHQERNAYFVFGSRRAMQFSELHTALFDPANCTPTANYSLLTKPDRFLAKLHECANAEGLDEDDALIELLRGEAKNLIHRARKTEENFGAFLEGASQRLISFNPAGRLGHYGRGAIRNIRELRERQIILFVMTPLSHQREFAAFTSLLNHNAIAAAKARPDGHRLHIVGEEALQYRFSDLLSDLETMRQLGVTMDFFIQSFAGLEKVYGRESAQAIESYADIRVYAGLNSLARAKHVSEMLSERTLRKQDFSFNAEARDLGISSREFGRPFEKPNEILRMDRVDRWVFVRGMNPMKLRAVTYAEVWPWCDWVGPSPISGTRLHAQPLVSIDYGRKGAA